jgi:hypothetical protein
LLVIPGISKSYPAVSSSPSSAPEADDAMVVTESCDAAVSGRGWGPPRDDLRRAALMMLLLRRWAGLPL